MKTKIDHSLTKMFLSVIKLQQVSFFNQLLDPTHEIFLKKVSNENIF